MASSSRPYIPNQSSLPNGASTGPGFLPNSSQVIQSGPKRILCLADVRGSLRSLNELAAQARADFIIHTGDFGFYDEESLDRIADKTLKHVAQYSPLLTENQKRIIQSSQPQQYDIKKRFGPHELQLSELGLFLSKQVKLNVPVYTVWGACEDVRVLEKFRAGTYKVDNLHIIDEVSSRLLELGGVKLRLLGLGGAVVMHKLFDNGEGQTTIAGGQGTMWTTLLQMGELVDTANRVYDPTETRVFITHASPAREGLLNQLSVTLKADFSVSAGLHFRYGSSYNEFSVNPSLDHYRGKLAASKASFNDVWETVKAEVEPAVASNDAQQTLLANALDIVTKMPTVANGGNPFANPGSIDESAFKNMWNFNLADAAFGYLILEVQDGRIGTEMKAQGFNFAHRITSGKYPGATQSVQSAVGAPGVGRGLPSQQSMSQPSQVGQNARVGQQGAPIRGPNQPPTPGAQGQVRAGNTPNSNPRFQNSSKPITPQSGAPSTPGKTLAQSNGVHEKGTPGDKPGTPGAVIKNNTRLFISGPVEGEQAVRDAFGEEDKVKIAKIETAGAKGNFVVHFKSHEEADNALKHQKGAAKAGGKGVIRAKWYEERTLTSRPRDSTGGQGGWNQTTPNRTASGTGSRPGYQSGASDTESGRGGRVGFQRARGRGSDRGRGSTRGGRGGASKSGDEGGAPAPAPAASASPAPKQENKPPPAAAAPAPAATAEKA